jgi:hypothetical protein
VIHRRPSLPPSSDAGADDEVEEESSVDEQAGSIINAMKARNSERISERRLFFISISSCLFILKIII